MTYLRTNTDLASLILGIFLGLLIVMAFYNLLLYFSLKDKVYLLYVGTTVFGILANVSINRLGDQFLWTNTSNTDAYLYMTFSGVSIYFSSRFTSVFLNLKEWNKKLNNLMWIIATFSILFSILSLTLTTEQVTPFGRWLVLLSFPCYVIVGSIAHKKGFKIAKYYLIAWTPYVLGLIIATMEGAKWIPVTNWVVTPLQIGGGLEIILLSFALAYRIKSMRIEIAEKELEKEQFKTKLLEDQKIILEETVKERTEELSIANDTKDKFFSIIAHDLRSPMIGLQGIGQKLEYFIKKNKQEKLLLLGGQIDESIDQLNHLLNNLLNWATTQTGRIPYHPEIIKINNLIDENVSLYQSIARSKDLNIITNLAESSIHADVNTISTVLRNLISNAIKFSPENGRVSITSNINNDILNISILDEGKGMNKEELENLFASELNKSKSGTKGEKGFGLGLKLCKEFTEMNQGTIEVKSEIKKGTEFILKFPISLNK